MEDFKKKNAMESGDKEIVFSKSVKAGKRIYYLDVKRNRKDELFLAITESKKVISGEGDNSSVSFEKHKIFLYKEDFEKFLGSLTETIEFINNNQAKQAGEEDAGLEMSFSEVEKAEALNQEIQIDIDFE